MTDEIREAFAAADETFQEHLELARDQVQDFIAHRRDGADVEALGSLAIAVNTLVGMVAIQQETLNHLAGLVLPFLPDNA